MYKIKVRVLGMVELCVIKNESVQRSDTEMRSIIFETTDPISPSVTLITNGRQQPQRSLVISYVK